MWDMELDAKSQRQELDVEQAAAHRARLARALQLGAGLMTADDYLTAAWRVARAIDQAREAVQNGAANWACVVEAAGLEAERLSARLLFTPLHDEASLLHEIAADLLAAAGQRQDPLRSIARVRSRLPIAARGPPADSSAKWSSGA